MTVACNVQYIRIQRLFQYLGCGKCWAIDGNWKLAFAHCMFPVQKSPVAIKLSLPNVCPEEPKGKNAFCTQHCTIVEEKGIPTNLKDFLSFSGVEGNDIHIIQLFSFALHCMHVVSMH